LSAFVWPIGTPYRAFLIPDEALLSDQGRKFLYVVNEKDEVVYRPATLGQEIQGLRVIKDGLQAGDRVIVSGMQRVRPGVQVQATAQPPPKRPESPLGKLMASVSKQDSKQDKETRRPGDKETKGRRGSGQSAIDAPGLPVSRSPYLPPCSRTSSSSGRSSLRCCRSSSRWPAPWRRSICRWRSIRRSRRPASWCRAIILSPPNANVVAESVAAPIEQQINGVEDMMYMVSQSNNDGSYTLTVTFKPGVNLNFAQVLCRTASTWRCALARRGETSRGDDAQAEPGHPARHRHLLAERALRSALPEQLRHDQIEGRAGPRRRRR